MATNFGGGAIAVEPLPSAVPVVEGTKTPPPVSNSVIENIFASANKLIANKAEAKKTSTLAEFSKQQLQIAEALEQGKIKNSAYALTLSRNNLLTAISANPSLTGDLVSAYSALMGLPGVDQIAKGTDEEQLWEAKRADLVSKGLLDPSADDSEVRRVAADERRVTALTDEYNIRMQTLNEQEKLYSINSAKRQEIAEAKKDTAYTYVSQISGSEFSRITGEFSKIVSGPGTETEKLQAIEDTWMQFQSDATGLGIELDGEDRTMFLKPFENLYDTYLKRATGQYTDEEVKRQVDRAISSNKLLLLSSSPEAGRLVAATELYGDNVWLQSVVSGSDKTVQGVLDFVAYGDPKQAATEQPAPYAENTTSRAVVKSYLEGLSSVLTSSESTSKDESMLRVQRVLSSMSDYQGLVEKSPKSAIELVNWLGSVQFGQVVEANPSLLEHTEAAKEALNRNYRDELVTMIDKEFISNKVSGILPVPKERAGTGAIRGTHETVSQETDKIVAAEATPSGMQFVAIDPKNPLAVQKAKDLNKTLKPIINTNLRAWAHLDNRKDYGAYWEELAPTFMDAGVEDTTPENNISMDDYKQLATLTAEFKPLQASIDRTEGGGDYDAILKFSHRSGGEFEGISVSKMTIQEALDFSQSGGEYAEYSKQQVGRMATPMGRYQIVGATLKATANEMGLSLDTVFDQTTQDAMFAHLVKKAISGQTSLKKKRVALRNVWEGFKNVSDGELDEAIAYFEDE